MRFLLLFVWISLISLVPWNASAQLEDPFRWDFGASANTVQAGESVPLEISFRIPPNYILYKDKITLTLAEGTQGFELAPLEFSPWMTKKDPFHDGEVSIFEGMALIKTSLKAAEGLSGAQKEIKLLLTYQGCSDTLCYRLMRKEIELPMTVTDSTTTASVGKSFWRGHFEGLGEHGLLLLLLLTFLGGLASDFTPCVLPIIPITLAFIGVRKETTTVRNNLFQTLFFVVAMAFTYALMGLAAALLGKSLGFLFQNVYFLLLTVALYLVFSLSLFGLFEIQVPLKMRNAFARMGGEGPFGAILAGLTIGFLAAPCVGPLIASLLLFVAQKRNLLEGFLLLFSYGLGMGSLFLVIGLFYHRVSSKIHGGPYMLWVKKIFAVLLLIPAFYYGSIAATHFKKNQPTVHQEYFWNDDAQQGFSKAAAEGKLIFLDFFASWCLPCVEMETRTFSDESLQRLLMDRFIPIKIDCTQETDQCQKMVEKYSVIGWPTFFILSPQGEVIETVVGKNLNATELIDILNKSLSSFSPHEPLR
jgi:thiol:disulfide interchange protein DsbD